MNLISFGVYQIVNIINNMSYVGSTGRCFGKRFFEHKIKLKNKRHNNTYLQRSWDKYGEENFEFKILEVLQDSNKLEEREQYWINFYKSNNKEFGYNLRKDAANNLGTKYPNRKKGYIVVAREIRICVCGCKQSFECKINFKQKFIRGHNSIGNENSLGKIGWNKGLTKETHNSVLQGALKKSILKIKNNCLNCGIEYERLPLIIGKYCSKLCANTFKIKGL